MPDNNDTQTANSDNAQTGVQTPPVNVKDVDQSPANGAADQPGSGHVDSVDADNEASREADAAPDDPVQRAVSGSNAGIDNSNARDAARGAKKKPTAYSRKPLVQDPNDPNPIKMDSFGQSGVGTAARPTMTPDLAEPLRNPANAAGAQTAADAGETSARLHAGMRATGARNYGLLDEPDQSDAQAASDAQKPAGALGEITQAEHALPLLKSKATELHSLLHNIGNVASMPIHAVEDLMADMRYLANLIHSKANKTT